MFTSEKMQLQCPSRPVVMDRRWKKTCSAEIAPNCPRCASPNTKFCYYNNYSLSQPRYFCKGCRRYWTKGGSLRNVPVGGGCRKNRRSSTKSTTNGVSPAAADHVSLSFCRTLTSSSSSTNSDHSCPSVIPHGTITDTEAPNIDLAVVFAKFLNQNSCFDPGPLPEVVEVDSPFSLTGSSSDLLMSTHESLLPIHQFPEEQLQQEEQGMHMMGSEFGLKGDACRNSEFMMDSDPNVYGLETILNDEFGQGMDLWSENAPATGVLPNFSWQASQIQGLEPVVVQSAADHHFACHPNDHWSFFDLSTASGVFSSSIP